MTQLQLVEHDITKDSINKIVAVSTSYQSLTKHCKTNYGHPISKTINLDTMAKKYYTISETEIDIVRETF